MLITRKTRVPLHWVFYAQIPFVMAIAASYITGAPFLYAMKKFIDNPAAITFLLSIEVFVTMLGGPFVSWLSDRIWTRHGRRKPFIIASEIPMALTLVMMPFAPDLITLICLRWIYGIVSDLSAPNQALTMEVVPARQRGMGAGLFNLQIQFVNLLFFFLVIGRFDDVFFTGPLLALFAVPGEVLIFASGGILLLSVGLFTWFGIHEVEPPNRQRVRDEKRPGENLLKTFARSFFKDVFGKSLLPLYLLLMVSALTTVSLGILDPLLYTDQWGYSLQEMGTNVAIGAMLGIAASLFAGWFADRTSKLRVYTVGLSLVLLSRIVWTIFVALKPDHRPELHEILLFGSISNVFGLIAGAASFPLILEFVERNRLGTAGAGMSLFGGTIRNGFTMLVGFYILWWSIFFLPQAGDRVQLVFKHELSAPALVQKLEAAGYPADTLDFEPMHRPGVDGDTSRHWKIRRPVAEAGDIHSQLKTLDTRIAKLLLKLDRPSLAPDAAATLTTEIDSLRAQHAALSARLADSAAAFKSDLLRILQSDLAPDGRQIIAASSTDNGTRLSLTLEFVEPVTTDITPRTLLETLGASQDTGERKTIAGEFARVMETVDINRIPTATTPAGLVTDYRPELQTVPLSGPVNAIELRLVRDPAFVVLEKALLLAEAEAQAAYNLASSVILPLRGLTSQNSKSYAIASARATLGELAFDLALLADDAPVDPAALQDALLGADGIERAEVAGTAPAYRVRLVFKESLQKKSDDDTISPVGARLRELLPQASAAELAAIENLARRATETAASRPVFLTAARPVVLARPADREYDYFFSMQYFMIVTDVLGLLVIALIVRLEKRGVIVRYGALEDARR